MSIHLYMSQLSTGVESVSVIPCVSNPVVLPPVGNQTSLMLSLEAVQTAYSLQPEMLAALEMVAASCGQQMEIGSRNRPHGNWLSADAMPAASIQDSWTWTDLVKATSMPTMAAMWMWLIYECHLGCGLLRDTGWPDYCLDAYLCMCSEPHSVCVV